MRLLTREAAPTPGRPAPTAAPRTPAAAVLGLQRAVGNRAVAQLMRDATTTAQPAVRSVVAGTGNDITVTMADGTRYRVTRRQHARTVDPGRPRVGLCHDDERVWLRVAWCRGTRGRIDVGANPQGALEDLLNSISDQISHGHGASDVISTIESASLQPFTEVDIARSGSWRVTGDVRVDVNRTGVTGVTGGVHLDLGWIRLGITGSATDLQSDHPGGQIGPQVEIPLDRPHADPCPRQEVEVTWVYECDRLVDDSYTYTPAPMQRHDEDTALLYFDYETDQLRTGSSGPGQANAQEQTRLADLIRRGWSITSIDGFTSPEGRRPAPTGRGAARQRFQGNDALSQARADAAHSLLERLTGGVALFRLRPAITASTPTVGRSEKYPLTHLVHRRGGDVEEELEGRELDQAVIDRFTADQAEMARLTDEDRAFVADRRHSVHARAERIYEYLRRAEIHLVHDWTQTFRPITIPWLRPERMQACPAAVTAAADRHWGHSPTRATDPSVCG